MKLFSESTVVEFGTIQIHLDIRFLINTFTVIMLEEQF